MAKKIFRFIGIAILSLFSIFIIFIVYAQITYYNPEQKLVLRESNSPDTIPVDSCLTALTWNIGYAGLGDNMDFFYDNGKKVRDTKGRTLENLKGIKQFIAQNKQTNFILLQEVDADSKRTYHINEISAIADTIKIQNVLGLNYNVNFVPIPPMEPMGKVISGIITFTRFTPELSQRQGYPGKFSWPNRLFNLRRCMVANYYPTSNGKKLVVVNTHNSAFDNGSLKTQEINYLKAFILEEYVNGNYVIVGGDWNQSPPDFPLETFGNNYKEPFFILTNIDSKFMPNNWTWAFDPTEPTNRYLNKPYTVGDNYTGILDFFLLSPNVSLQKVKTTNLQFRNSDHNPVSLSFRLKPD
ncbi:MAG TPA: hypothetical protein PLA24_01045 [Tenuifilaceae bacterium]|nr:hypothetical protein [Tenuifilaceae bacterium]